MPSHLPRWLKGIILQTAYVKPSLPCKMETQEASSDFFFFLKHNRVTQLTESVPPSECQQDMRIPSIVFITLQLPNMFLPFTDLSLWTGEPFKCFPFKSNAYALFTPKHSPFTPPLSRSTSPKKLPPETQRHIVLYWRLLKVGVECFGNKSTNTLFTLKQQREHRSWLTIKFGVLKTPDTADSCTWTRSTKIVLWLLASRAEQLMFFFRVAQLVSI